MKLLLVNLLEKVSVETLPISRAITEERPQIQLLFIIIFGSPSCLDTNNYQDMNRIKWKTVSWRLVFILNRMTENSRTLSLSLNGNIYSRVNFLNIIALNLE